MRFIGPVGLLCAAVWMAWYNATHPGSMVVLAFIDRLPGVGDDLVRQSEASWMLVAGIGALWLVGEIVVAVQRSRRPDED